MVLLLVATTRSRFERQKTALHIQLSVVTSGTLLIVKHCTLYEANVQRPTISTIKRSDSSLFKVSDRYVVVFAHYGL